MTTFFFLGTVIENSKLTKNRRCVLWRL